MKYKGEITKFNKEGKYGFIKLESITKENGTPHLLQTKKDIFIHQNNYRKEIKEGMIVLFEIIPSLKHGKEILCATKIEDVKKNISKKETVKLKISEERTRKSLKDYAKKITENREKKNNNYSFPNLINSFLKKIFT